MKKIIFVIILIASMLASSTLHVFADTFSKTDTSTDSLISYYNDNLIYVERTHNETVVVVDSKECTDVSILLYDTPDIIYQWRFEKEEFKKTGDDETFVKEVINYVLNDMSSAEIIKITDVTYDKLIDVTDEKSSAGADLKADLIAAEGSEYTGTFKATYIYQGHTFRVYESKYMRVYSSGYNTWSAAMTVASMIANILGKTVTNAIVKAICTAFDLVVNAASYISPGRVNKYNCRAITQRYVTMDGGSYEYNETSLFVNYMGYEDNDTNSTGRASIDTSSREVDYIDGQTYYNSYYSQVVDAYNTYLIIGWQS